MKFLSYCANGVLTQILTAAYTRRMKASCGQFWLERVSRTNQAANVCELTRLK